MTAVLAKDATQGVLCRNCGKPIRLSHALLNGRIATVNSDLASKIFPARCRRCGRENLYSIDETIVIAAHDSGPGERQRENHLTGPRLD